MEVSKITKKEDKKGPKVNSPQTVMYVEVNDANFRNCSCYSLTSNGERLFDIAIIFAANINFNVSERRAYLYFNPNVDRVLSNLDTYVRPVQNQGTKVLLSILGNHEGAGFCNFETVEAARDFAGQLADAVARYGLDGIDFDDEYADYGNNGTTQPNPYSFLYLLRELRALLPPEKIISFYYYGPAASRLTYQDLVAGDFLNYSWNAIYGSYSAPNVPNMTRSQLGPAAVNVQQTGESTASNLARRTIDDGYGIFLCYALPNTDRRAYMSAITRELYGSETTLAAGCLQNWPVENDGDTKPCCCSCAQIK